jgi:hypothetical protein
MVIAANKQFVIVVINNQNSKLLQYWVQSIQEVVAETIDKKNKKSETRNYMEQKQKLIWKLSDVIVLQTSVIVIKYHLFCVIVIKLHMGVDLLFRYFCRFYMRKRPKCRCY